MQGVAKAVMRRWGGEGRWLRQIDADLACGDVVPAQRRHGWRGAAPCNGPEDQKSSADENRPRQLHAKLGRFLQLTPGDSAALDTLTQHPRAFGAGEILIHEGEQPHYACLILEGFAYRYKLLPDGQRQILGYLLAGDLCDVDFTDGNRPDHNIATLSDAIVALIPLRRLVDVRVLYPRIDHAFSLAAMLERSILRHWLLNVGQRNALQRVSHFLCELSVRLRALDHSAAGDPIDLPVSQAALADTTGMTTVHVNRMLQRLRGDGLIALRRNGLTILDFERLATLADFDENYLLQERYPG